MKKVCLPQAAEDLALGKVLGRREAFAAVAGRCSAAEAMQIRQLREEKQYLKSAGSWREFCRTYLHMSRSNADRIIGLLDEFGPDYFAIAQITRIAPETYRAIAPAIREGALHAEGEAIALIPENAARVGAAVSALRPRPAAVKVDPPPPAAQERIAAIDRRWQEIAADFHELARSWRRAPEHMILESAYLRTRTAVLRLGNELGL